MELFILSILVSNHFGVLTRVTNLFSRRGYNIKELTVGETEDSRYSRITILTEDEKDRLEQIELQLAKLVDVKAASSMAFDECVDRELLLIKTKEGSGAKEKISHLKTQLLENSEGCEIYQVVGNTAEINEAVELLKNDVIEVCRTGAVALSKGKTNIKNK